MLLGAKGRLSRKMGDESTDLSPLLDVILEKVPDASVQGASLTSLSRMPLGSSKMSAQVFNLGYDNF